MPSGQSAKQKRKNLNVPTTEDGTPLQQPLSQDKLPSINTFTIGTQTQKDAQGNTLPGGTQVSAKDFSNIRDIARFQATQPPLKNTNVGGINLTGQSQATQDFVNAQTPLQQQQAADEAQRQTNLNQIQKQTPAVQSVENIKAQNPITIAQAVEQARAETVTKNTLSAVGGAAGVGAGVLLGTAAATGPAAPFIIGAAILGSVGKIGYDTYSGLKQQYTTQGTIEFNNFNSAVSGLRTTITAINKGADPTQEGALFNANLASIDNEESRLKGLTESFWKEDARIKLAQIEAFNRYERPQLIARRDQAILRPNPNEAATFDYAANGA